MTVQAGAILVILPGPAIPYQGCRFYQRAEIELHPGAHCLWGDVWTAGRYARGKDSEQFRFETVVQDLTVRRHHQLVYRDRFCWQGPWNAASANWHFGTFPAFGNLFATGAAKEVGRRANQTEADCLPFPSSSPVFL